MYLIQDYALKFVIDMGQVGGFLRVNAVSPANKTDRHDINEILLKVALTTITLTPFMDLKKQNLQHLGVFFKVICCHNFLFFVFSFFFKISY
jgi:hypothetical protein